MFMLRGSDGRLEEVGRVYVYLQRGPLDLELSEPHLTGVDVYGRFGNTITPLGDLNQDGFNGGWLVLVLPSRQVGEKLIELSIFRLQVGDSGILFGVYLLTHIFMCIYAVCVYK